MHLINVNTGALEYSIGSRIPEYAILSHTWEDGELTYQTYLNGQSGGMKGIAKIVKTCELAKKYKISYVWIDTACIDKSSSAELSEAINSMYLWYKRAVVCFTFLSDLPPNAALDVSLQRCRWL